MKFSTLAVITIIILGLSWIIGCSDDPNAVGISILPPQDSLHIVTYTASATSTTSFLDRVRGTSSTLLIGKSNGMEIRTLLQFAGISAIPSTAIIDSAVLNLHIVYRFKDSSGTLGFEVHRMTQAFTGTTFTWDSTTASGVYSDTVSGTFLRNITNQDTIVSVRLDTTLLKQWRQTDNGSIILLPNSPNTNIVAGVSNSTFLPQLTISYHDSTDTTKTISPTSSSGLFVADGTLPVLPSSFILQAGIVDRGIIRFDSLSLAVPLKASITQAILEVSLDTSSSLMNSYTVDNIVAYLLRKNTLPYDSVALGTSCTPAYIGAQKIYRADIKAIVQQWFIHEPNNGLLLRAGSELTTLDRFALYGANASVTLRPRLKITYTVLP